MKKKQLRLSQYLERTARTEGLDAQRLRSPFRRATSLAELIKSAHYAIVFERTSP
ncbi:MAG: hypothetical protein QOH24_1282 [Verrucomicrobiota bacterium]